MNLSISNIAWSEENDTEIFKYLSAIGFIGLEIAPTRIIAKTPYNYLDVAKVFADKLKAKYNISISSIQSIWFGKTERLFGTKEERNELTKYTKKAIDFANIMSCPNIVFGCPKNRIIDDDEQYTIAYEFFYELGQYAINNGTVLSIEPNPLIYGTNFINRTEQAFEFVKGIGSSGIMVNIDLGTMIYNNEAVKSIGEHIALVNHVHISEPYLTVIEKRDVHKELSEILKKNSYDKFVSIEMKNLHDIGVVKRAIQYVKEVFE